MTDTSPFDDLIPEERVAPPSVPQYKLTDEQQAACDGLVEYMVHLSAAGYRLLKGYAGTGKTFTITRAIKSARALSSQAGANGRRLSIVASAPTHKAVRVLKKTAELGGGVDYATIHSLLGLRPDVDDKTGKQVFKPSSDPSELRIENYNTVIVDEVSMLGVELFELLIEKAAEFDIRVVFLGDPCQIPPVGELDSMPLIHPEKYGITVYELTRSMRQAGTNPILDLATEIRKVYKTGKVYGRAYAREFEGTGIEAISSTEVSKIDQILEDKFCSADFKADADHMKVIAWRNEIVNSINGKVRKMIYEVPKGLMALPKLMNGEKLVMDKPYVLSEENGRMIPNNEEVEVVNYQVMKRAIRYKQIDQINDKPRLESFNPTCYKAFVEYYGERGDKRRSIMWIMHEESQAQYESVLKSILTAAKSLPFQHVERKPMFRHYYEVMGMFADVKYNYAITAHKSQGSTYDYCMLVEWDIHKNNFRDKIEERNRVQYVAVTRARKKLFIID